MADKEKIPKIHTLPGTDQPIGYRVTTADLKSLGLRRNPNILQYSIGEWSRLPEDQVKEGKQDWGGIWVARTLSKAAGLRDYMKNMYGMETRIFIALIGEILYANDYRVKTNAILLLNEILKDGQESLR